MPHSNVCHHCFAEAFANQISVISLRCEPRHCCRHGLNRLERDGGSFPVQINTDTTRLGIEQNIVQFRNRLSRAAPPE